MTTELVHILRLLREELFDAINTSEIPISEAHRIRDVIKRIDMASIRLQLESIADDRGEFHELTVRIHESIRKIREARRNFISLSAAIDEATTALNVVIAHVEPDEPWPRGGA